jgi:hypothetical protein
MTAAEFNRLFPDQGIKTIVMRGRSVKDVLSETGRADLYAVPGGVVIRPIGGAEGELARLHAEKKAA